MLEGFAAFYDRKDSQRDCLARSNCWIKLWLSVRLAQAPPHHVLAQSPHLELFEIKFYFEQCIYWAANKTLFSCATLKWFHFWGDFILVWEILRCPVITSFAHFRESSRFISHCLPKQIHFVQPTCDLIRVGDYLGSQSFLRDRKPRKRLFQL